ncbi:D-glucuronyl C5-epimerase family protein [Oceanithermus sp.]|uniref:D-glucuronyl C5-epimerase family protein n=1 Tax=Oceanithermus sp. TaxID=2268145 RepID=UPI0025DA74F8|nr:D-glucuronyl C5-epimerase family protein [Oceanithermus sp.]
MALLSPQLRSRLEATHKIAIDLVGYLLGGTPFRIHPEADGGEVYPVDLGYFLRRERRYFEPKDALGIPLRRFPDGKPQYVPTRVAAYGLARFNRYLERGNAADREAFLRVANWFMRPKDALWRYTFDRGRLRAPWISAMAQGQGVSVLVRAWRTTGEARYLEQARRATIPFQAPIAAGGLRSSVEGRCPFWEEYPEEPPVHVLNGFFFALIGVLDLATHADDATSLARSMSDAVERCVELWDLGYWSSYDLAHRVHGWANPATVAYHQLHVAQLRFLAQHLGSERLRATAARWEGYARDPRARLRAMWEKVRLRMHQPAPGATGV